MDTVDWEKKTSRSSPAAPGLPINPADYQPGLPEFKQGDGGFKRDLALLYLNKPFVLTPEVKTVRLPTKRQCENMYGKPFSKPTGALGRARIRVIGWGKSRLVEREEDTIRSKDLRTWLQYLEVPHPGGDPKFFDTSMYRNEWRLRWAINDADWYPRAHPEARQSGMTNTKFPPHNYYTVPRQDLDWSPTTSHGDSGGPWVWSLDPPQPGYPPLQLAITHAGEVRPGEDELTGHDFTYSAVKMCFENAEYVYNTIVSPSKDHRWDAVDAVVDSDYIYDRLENPSKRAAIDKPRGGKRSRRDESRNAHN